MFTFFYKTYQNIIMDIIKCWILHTVCASNNLTKDKECLVKCLISKHSHKRTTCTMTYCRKRFCDNWFNWSCLWCWPYKWILCINASINDFLQLIPLNYSIMYRYPQKWTYACDKKRVFINTTYEHVVYKYVLFSFLYLEKKTISHRRVWKRQTNKSQITTLLYISR